MRAPGFLALALVAGCWRIDLEQMEAERLPFEPLAELGETWWVESFDLGLSCPDGEPAQFYMIYPDSQDQREQEFTEPMPLAIIFHSGAFDYIYDPDPTAPLEGPGLHAADPGGTRLFTPWAQRHAFTTFGMYPNLDDVEIHDGTLTTALAERGFAMMLPLNCWGDMWHNRSGAVENDYGADLFYRDGRTAAEFAYYHATSDFPPSNPIELPIEIHTDQIFLVGLGEGGRAASELLTIQRDTDGNGGLDFPIKAAGLIMDSPVSDLTVYAPGGSEAFQRYHNGLLRLFPEGGRGKGAFQNIPRRNLPQRVGLLWSTEDSRIPAGSNDAAIALVEDESLIAEGWVFEDNRAAHILINDDLDLARAVADFMAQGPSGIPEAFQP